MAWDVIFAIWLAVFADHQGVGDSPRVGPVIGHEV